MNRKSTAWVLFALVTFFATVSYSQEPGYKWAIGLNAGAQKIFGDRNAVSFAPAFEGLVNYRMLDFADLSFALGYSQLKYSLLQGLNSTTNIINADLKGNFELMSTGTVRPFVSLGVGIANFHVGQSSRGRFNDAALIGGGGVKIRLAPQFDGVLGADYRWTTGDSFDNPTLSGEGASKDGFLNFRAGVTYNLPTREQESFDVIASERAPLYEVGKNGDGESVSTEAEDVETKNVNEYAELKTTVDHLSENVSAKDQKIEDLQGQVYERKQEIAMLEKGAADQKSVKLVKNTSMSGFSEIYKEALTNYYNKNHAEAVSLFEVLLQQYPDHALASNCQFWVAQSLFAMNRYEESIDAFYKVLSYDRSLKKDDSLFFLGRSYLKTGAGQKAKESFSRLVTNYPTSEYFTEAREYIGKL